MSAINEWFGYNNSIYLYIMRTYGEQELDSYFQYLVKEAYSDVTPKFREGGLAAIQERYVKNFKKDGDEASVVSERTEDTLVMYVRCPGFFHSPKAAHPDRQLGPFFCQCCKKLNTAVLQEAGYALELSCDGCGDCVWKIRQEKKI